MAKVISLTIGLLSLACVLLVAGCGGGGGTRLRFMNAVPDIADLDLLIDTKSVATNVAYSTATSYQSVAAGSRQVEVEQSGMSTALFPVQAESFASGTDTTVFAENFSFAPSTLKLFTDNNTAPATNDFTLRIINMSTPDVGPLNVYVATPPINIFGVSPTISSLGSFSASNYLSLGANTYEIVVAEPGGGEVLDTGTSLPAFAAQQVRTFVILDDQGGGCCTYTLLHDVN